MLTDDEITLIVRECARGSAINRDGSTSHRIARAVIAAYEVKLREQEPDYWANPDSINHVQMLVNSYQVKGYVPLYLHPAPIPEGWINPNDKTQKKYLPWIGEECIFTHGGIVYYGSHNGGSFVHGKGFCCKHFSTWDCLWMPLPKPPMAAARSE